MEIISLHSPSEFTLSRVNYTQRVNSVNYKFLHVSIYFYVIRCISIYFNPFLCISMYFYVFYLFPSISTYFHLFRYISMYFYIFLCISMYFYLFLFKYIKIILIREHFIAFFSGYFFQDIQ